jgi:hypothetical protein
MQSTADPLVPFASTIGAAAADGAAPALFIGENRLTEAQKSHIARLAEMSVLACMRWASVQAIDVTAGESTVNAATLAAYAAECHAVIEVDSPLFVLPEGPFTTITSLSIDGQALNFDETTPTIRDLRQGPWTLRYRTADCFRCGQAIAITGTVGWSSGAAVPQPIIAAVNLMQLHLANQIHGDFRITGETIGPFTKQRHATRLDNHVEAAVRDLVMPWTRPHL